nr:MAG TPA_asm: hypothetical protein [Bacteriophage sp.]
MSFELWINTRSLPFILITILHFQSHDSMLVKSQNLP